MDIDLSSQMPFGQIECGSMEKRRHGFSIDGRYAVTSVWASNLSSLMMLMFHLQGIMRAHLDFKSGRSRVRSPT
jgi:hypothetical protein